MSTLEHLQAQGPGTGNAGSRAQCLIRKDGKGSGYYALKEYTARELKRCYYGQAPWSG